MSEISELKIVRAKQRLEKSKATKKRIADLETKLEKAKEVLREVRDKTRDWDCSDCPTAADIIDLGVLAADVLKEID